MTQSLFDIPNFSPGESESSNPKPEDFGGKNCGDALANYLNSTHLKDTGYSLPRGGIGPGELASVGASMGSGVYNKNNLTYDNLTPGTVIHMTRQPGDKNYDYGSTHIGMVDSDEQGNKVFKSYTAGKGWRSQQINENFINELPHKITATNPVNPELATGRSEQLASKIAFQTGQVFDIPNYQEEGQSFDIPQPTPEPTAQSTPSLGATSDTMAQFASPAGQMVGDAIDLPSKWLLRKPLEYLHGKLIEPSRQRTIDEFGKYVQEPGAGTAAPEAFGALPNKASFVTPVEMALQPTLFNLLGKVGSLGSTLPEKAARHLYASAMKIPPKKVPNELRNRILQTGLEEKISVSQSGLDKTRNIVDDLNTQISNYIEEGAGQGQMVYSDDVVKRLDDLRKYYGNSMPHIRDKALGIIDELESSMLTAGNIPIDKAQLMKQNTYRDLRKQYGEMKGPEIEGTKALARGLKEEIATQIPEVSALNARESKLLNLLEVLDPAVNRVGNYDILRFGDAIGAVLGGTMGGPAGAKLGLLARRGIDTPGIKSRLGILLNSIKGDPTRAKIMDALRTGAPYTTTSQPLKGQESDRDRFLRGLAE